MAQGELLCLQVLRGSQAAAVAALAHADGSRHRGEWVAL